MDGIFRSDGKKQKKTAHVLWTAGLTMIDRYCMSLLNNHRIFLLIDMLMFFLCR